MVSTWRKNSRASSTFGTTEISIENHGGNTKIRHFCLVVHVKNNPFKSNNAVVLFWVKLQTWSVSMPSAKGNSTFWFPLLTHNTTCILAHPMVQLSRTNCGASNQVGCQPESSLLYSILPSVRTKFHYFQKFLHWRYRFSLQGCSDSKQEPTLALLQMAYICFFWKQCHSNIVKHCNRGACEGDEHITL